MLSRLYLGKTLKKNLELPVHAGCRTSMEVFNIFTSKEEYADAILQVSAGEVDETCAADLAAKIPKRDHAAYGEYALAVLTPFNSEPLHLRIEGESVRVPAGSYVVVNPKENAVPEPGHAFSATMVTFFQPILRDTREAVGISKSAGPFDFARTVQPATPTIQAAFRDLLKFGQSAADQDDAPWAPLQVYVAGFQLLAALWKEHPSQLKERMHQRGFLQTKDERLNRALEYMRVHFTESCRNEVIAQVAGLSPQHFYRMFQQAMACTPREYLRRLRVEQAERLLRRTPKGKSTLADIANAVGLKRAEALKEAYMAVRGRMLDE